MEKLSPAYAGGCVLYCEAAIEISRKITLQWWWTLNYSNKNCTELQKNRPYFTQQ